MSGRIEWGHLQVTLLPGEVYTSIVLWGQTDRQIEQGREAERERGREGEREMHTSNLHSERGESKMLLLKSGLREVSSRRRLVAWYRNWRSVPGE